MRQEIPLYPFQRRTVRPNSRCPSGCPRGAAPQTQPVRGYRPQRPHQLTAFADGSSTAYAPWGFPNPLSSERSSRTVTVYALLAP